MQISQLKNTNIHKIVLDQQNEKWPFKNDSLDLIINNLSLHWQNDPKQQLEQYMKSLEPDGAVIGTLYGDNTLQELRVCFTLAENERYGGVSQHMSPLFSITELGNVLSRCSYNLPTIFSLQYSLLFDSGIHLMQYLQDTGEKNCLNDARNGIHKNSLYGALAIYDSMFKDENDMTQASFEVIHFTGWKYHESQAKPKERGSADFNMKDFAKQILDQDQVDNIQIKSGEIVGDEIIENNNKFVGKNKYNPYK